MGPSGAVKTSLLAILSGRVKASHGHVLLNGLVVKKRLKSMVGYVHQDDLLMGNLTVRETLRYAAMLRLPSSTSYPEKMAKVDFLLKQLKLSHCADTLVGEVGISKGISGGERKRLGVAIELLTDPPILLCKYSEFCVNTLQVDEPTSSLDAKTALDVVKTISQLAKQNGTTVIMSIHQPRSDIFEILDDLMLMSRGKIAYFGPCQNVCPYFAKIGFPMHDNYNPADFVMDLITEDLFAAHISKKSRTEQDERIKKILNSYEQSVIEQSALSSPLIKEHLAQEERKLPKRQRSSWLTQFLVLCMRGFLNQWRDYKYTKTKMVQQVIYAILVGFFYFQTANDQKSVQSKLGLLFFVITNQWSNSLGTPSSMFREERPHFFRERNAKCFSISSYYFARLFSDLFLMVIHTVLFGSIIYALAGLNPAVDRYLMFMFIILTLSNTAHSVGTLLAIVIPKAEISVIIMPFISTTLHIFSGFYRNIEQIPPFLSWFLWVSSFQYGFKAIIINEFGGRELECPPAPEECAFPTGEFILDHYGMNTVLTSVWPNVAILFGISVVVRIISFLCMKYLLKSNTAA